MSLESQVADLVSASNKLITTFNDKKAAIDAALATAVAAAPEMKRGFYVDQVAGSDKTGSGTEAAPFKTIQAAIDATPSIGSVDVVLLSDYVLDTHVKLNNRRVVVRSVWPNQYRLQLNEFINIADNTRRMGSFWQSNNSSLSLEDLYVSLPDGANGSQLPVSSYYSLMFGSGASVPNIGQLRTYNVTFELRGTFVGKLIVNMPLIALHCTSTTIPTGLNGKFLDGIAAGTKPETLPRIITNLSSL